MNLPENLLDTEDHEWVKIDGNTATVGITDFAQSQLGDIVYVEIETEGDELDAAEVFGSVEAVKTVADLYMPVGGTVSEINGELEDEPELVNTDPYGKGWLIKITTEDGFDTDDLLSVEAYTEHVKAQS